MNENNFDTEQERRISKEAGDLLSKLLDDLKAKGLLRKPKPQEKRRLLSVLDNTGRLQDAFNVMTKQYDGEDMFAEYKKRTRLSEETLILSFLSQTFSTLLICYEIPIKLPLVFFLDKKSGIRKSMALGTVLKILWNDYPCFVTFLDSVIDKDFRNAIAHGTFWIEERELHYAENGYLEGEKVKTFKELQTEMKRVSIIGKAFVHVIRQRAERGYF